MVRIAFIGMGKRGKESLKNFLHYEGVQIKAICDPNPINIDECRPMLREHGIIKIRYFTEWDDWRKVCEMPDIDLVYISTDRSTHTPMAVYAMECGKHVAVEVPAATTIDECWQLVDTAEIMQRHCMMLENCCYSRTEMALLNMHQHRLFGEIMHAEGAYIHDLRELDFLNKHHYLKLWSQRGNPYPTHGLGPLCQLLEIHRNDKMEWINSVSSAQFTFPDIKTAIYAQPEYVSGNINTSIIRTQKGKTIVLQHDISSPRPYSRNYLISGTKGFAQIRPELKLAFMPDHNEFMSKQATSLMLRDYDHPFYKLMGRKARMVDKHDGMNYIMNYRLIYCLQNGLPLDMDVYDAVEWSCISELTSISISYGSVPVSIPDFTRGDWNKQHFI